MAISCPVTAVTAVPKTSESEVIRAAAGLVALIYCLGS